MRRRHDTHRLVRKPPLLDRLRPTPVEVEVTGPDQGVELAECLGRRGFPVATIEGSGHWLDGTGRGLGRLLWLWRWLQLGMHERTAASGKSLGKSFAPTRPL